MKFKAIAVICGMMGSLSAQAAWGSQSAREPAAPASLSQCVALRTTGADRLLTARWLFAVMAKSPQIADLAAVTNERRIELDKAFARLLIRIVNQDCIEEVRPLVDRDAKDGFGQVGRALGETAMGELLGGKEVDQAVSAYAGYLSPDDFKPLMDSMPKAQSGKGNPK
jgi:hypothetical protein